MTNNLATVQTNTISNREYWEKRMLRIIALERQSFVFSTLGREIDIPANAGTTTISVARHNHLPVGNHLLSEGQAPTAMKIETQKVQASVNEYGALLKFTNWVDDIHLFGVMKDYQPEMARHAAEVKERGIIASFADASEYFCGTGNTDEDELEATDVATLKDFRLVALTMRNYHRKGNAKFGGKFGAIVHPNVMNDLLDDDALEKKLLVPGQENAVIKAGTLDGYVAYGIVFKETDILEPTAVNLGTESAPNMLNVYTSVVLGEDPYVITSLKSIRWTSKGFTEDSGDPLAQNAFMGYRFWHGAKVIDPLAITLVKSASAYDSTIADFTTDDMGRAASQA